MAPGAGGLTEKYAPLGLLEVIRGHQKVNNVLSWVIILIAFLFVVLQFSVEVIRGHYESPGR